jgi:hypothetical protein
MPLYAATAFPDGPRPLIPERDVELRYQCPSCDGAWHRSRVPALIDTGATQTFAGAAVLPRGHVAWDQLVTTQSRFNHGNRRSLRVGRWRVDVYVLGILAATDILVTEPEDGPSSRLEYFMLGLPALTRFKVAFLWSNQPPAFILEPVGQLPELLGLDLGAKPDFIATHILPGIAAPTAWDSRTGALVADRAPALLPQAAAAASRAGTGRRGAGS